MTKDQEKKDDLEASACPIMEEIAPEDDTLTDDEKLAEDGKIKDWTSRGSCTE